MFVVRFASPTKFKHVVPALTEDFPGFREHLVQPARHGHGEESHHKHGVDGLDEALSLFWNDRVQASNSGLKQYWGDTWKRKKNKKKGEENY